jgi:hypothetical protein
MRLNPPRAQNFRQSLDASISVPDARLADSLDAGLNPGLVALA